MSIQPVDLGSGVNGIFMDQKALCEDSSLALAIFRTQEELQVVKDVINMMGNYNKHLGIHGNVTYFFLKKPLLTHSFELNQ